MMMYHNNMRNKDFDKLVRETATNLRRCKRCKHVWAKKIAREPVVCPRCKSYQWDMKKEKKYE